MAKLDVDLAGLKAMLGEVGASDDLINATIEFHGEQSIMDTLHFMLELTLRRAVLATQERGEDYISTPHSGRDDYGETQ